uniref:Copper-sensing two-component system response regulator CusR n=1 Tax=Klebsiella pneumoniae TaxID=573 RepID=A0A8B0STJ0_KLEPN|nr:Copper-sensing two-component system response regulator CusR [Klebsiella pneumoniae]
MLTSKEFSLLEFFIRHQGEVLPPLPDCLSGLGHEFLTATLTRLMSQ